MTEVDERIVAMHFDNKQFEKGAKETIETLEKLRESLDLEDAAESLNDLGKAASELDLSEQAQNAEKFSKALSGLKDILGKAFSFAMSPISKMGNALSGLAINVKKWFGIDLARDIEQAATRMVRSLTVEPVSAGWNEYEMKMDSVKTIMAGTKKEFADLSDEEHMGKVKDVLEQLNHYADETIYSFKDMTSSIGKFTNAGVHLDTAAKSMMGISNLAAQAGQGTQQASMAMYNFSQAMGLGYVELRDWRSIENANMATAEFKDTLVDVGVALGTLKKDSKGTVTTAVKGQKKVAVTAENLRETLNKKWLTSDVLSTTLEIYSGNLSEKEIRALGNFTDEQVSQFLAIGSEAKKAATQVRTFSKMYDALKEAAQSGWAESFEYIIGDMNEATELWSMVNDHISGWIDKSREARNTILANWRGMTADGSMRVSEIDGREELKISLENILNIMGKIGDAVKKAFTGVFGSIDGFELANWSKRFREMTENLSKWLGELEDPESRISKFVKVIKGLLSPIKLVLNVVKSLAKIVIDTVMPFIDPLLDFFAAIGETISLLVDGKFGDIGKVWSNFFASILTSLSSSFAKVKEKFAMLFGSLFSAESLENNPVLSTLANIYGAVSDFIDRVRGWSGWTVLSDFFENSILGPIRNFIKPQKEGEPSELKKRFDAFVSKINSFKTKVSNWDGWNKLGTFFNEKILGPIRNFIKPQKEGEPSELKKRFDAFVSKINSFKTKVSNWDGWNKLGTFFNEKILGPIRNFIKPQKEGEPSELKKRFDAFVDKINFFKTKVSNWDGWNKLSTFFNEKILGPIRNFIKPQKEGEPSELKKRFDAFVDKINFFKTKVSNWDGWNKLGTFFNEKILGPIRNFIKPKDGAEPSSLKETFDNIVGKVVEFKNSIAEWDGWDKLWTFFNDKIITPITRFYNWLFHGDADYGKQKAGTPMGVVATAFASDAPMLARQSKTTTSTLESITTELSSALGKIVGSTDIFEEKDENNKSAFERIMDWFGNLGTTLSEEWEKVKAPIAEISEQLTSGVTSVKDAINQAIEFLTTEDWEHDFTIIANKLEELGNGLIKFNTGLKTGKVLSGLGSLFGGAGSLFTSLANGKGLKISLGIPGVEEAGKSAASTLKNVGEQITSDMKKEGSSNWLNSIINGGKDVSQIKDSQAKLVQSYANTIIEFAGAMAALAYAIDQLVKTIERVEAIEDADKKQNIWDKFKMLTAGMLSAVGGTEIIALVSSIKGESKVKTVGNALIGFAVAMEGMVLAVTQLAELSASGKDLTAALDILDHLSLVIGAFAALSSMELGGSWIGSDEITNLNASLGKNKTTGLVGFAVALVAMVQEVKSLAEKGATLKDGYEEAIKILDSLTNLISRFVLAANLTTSSFGFQEQTSKNFVKNYSKSQAGMSAMYGVLGNGLTKSNSKDKRYAGSLNASFGENKSAGLFGFMSAIISMCEELKSLAEKDLDKLKAATDILSVLAGVIDHFVVIANLTTSEAHVEMGTFDLSLSAGKNKSSGIIGFVAGLYLLTGQLIKLSEQDPGKLNAAANVVTKLGNMMTTFVGTKGLTSLFTSSINLGSFVYKGGKTNGIIGFVLAINELLIATTLLADKDVTQIRRAEGVISHIGSMITAFTGIYGLTSGIGDTGQRITGILSIVAFAGVIWLIMHEVTQFAEMDVDQYDRAIEVMDKVGELISGIGKSLLGTDGLLAVISMLGGDKVGFGDVAKGTLKVLEAIGIIFVAVGALGWLLGAIFDDEFTKQLEEGAEVAGKVGSFLGNFVAGILKPVRDVFTENVVKNDADAINNLSEAMETIDDEKLDYTISIMGKVRDFADTLRGFDPTLFQKWFSGDITIGQFASYMEQLAKGINALGGVESDKLAMAGLAVSMVQAIAEAAHVVEGTTMGELQALTEFIYTMAHNIVFGENGVDKGLNSITTLFYSIGEAIAKGLEEGSASITSDSIIDKIVQGIESGKDRIRDSLAAALTAGFEEAKVTVPTTGGTPKQSETESITDPLVEGVTETVSNAGNIIADKTGALQQNAEKAASQFGSVFTDGLSRILSGESVDAVLPDMLESSKSIVTNTATEMGNVVGINLTSATADTINEHSDEAANATAQMGRNMGSAFNNELEIESPSKVFQRSAGYIVQAVANGISQHQSVIDQIRLMGYDMLMAWQQVLAPIEAYLNSKLSFDNGMSPVYTASTRSWQGLGFRPGEVVPSLSRNVSSPDVRENGQNSSQIVAAINDRIDQLNANIANLKLYLDTGAFVGATVSMYDKALGFRAARSARG